MRHITLNDLPAPPPGKTGWPWTEESPQYSEKMSGSVQLPKISIITPSFNQGRYIEETIRSVLLQGYPDLEYIIIDGGSTDDTVEIIRKYENWLTYWETEPDQGQSHAINKGFARSSGVIMSWLNSDDFYLKGTLSKIIPTFLSKSDTYFIYGDAVYASDNGSFLGVFKSKETSLRGKLNYWNGWYIPQPTVFFRRDIYLKIGEIDQSLNYALDYDYFLRAAFHYDFHYIPDTLAAYRLHDLSKTGDWQSTKVFFHNESKQIVTRHVKDKKFLYYQWRLSYVLRGPMNHYIRYRRYFRAAVRKVVNIIVNKINT